MTDENLPEVGGPSLRGSAPGITRNVRHGLGQLGPPSDMHNQANDEENQKEKEQ